MKKLRMFLLAALFLLMPILSACSDAEDIEEIREQFFARQVESIFMNLERYTGRTIRLEGIFMSWHDEWETNETYYFVLRWLSDDCCGGGGGGSAGFELHMGDFAPPPDDAWVQVTGVLELVDGWMPNNPVLVVTAIEELATRGAEVIFQ